MASIQSALRVAITALKKTSPSPQLDAELLLSKVLNKNRTFLYAHNDTLLKSEELAAYQTLIKNRLSGMPIAYLTGSREFWSLPLKVNKHTLIPRPETELLVEIALSFIENKPVQILDLGTGSGAIALACASERPLWKITASDVNLDTLNVAKENALDFGFNQIHFCHSNWFDNLDQTLRFDAILSNPPYISTHYVPQLTQELHFEPAQALYSGEEGLDAIQLIIRESLARLKPGGLLLIEHGFDQKPAVQSMLKKYGYGGVQTWVDINGHNRVSGGKK